MMVTVLHSDARDFELRFSYFLHQYFMIFSFYEKEMQTTVCWSWLVPFFGI